jgi:hypothetical protein
MIGNAPRHAGSTSCSVWEPVGQLRSELAEVLKEQVVHGFKEMEDLHKTENSTSNQLMDLAVSFDNLAST